MDFAWSDQQKELLAAVDRFVKEQLNYDMIENDRNAVFNHDAWKKCAGFGIQGLPVSEEYGGLGQDPLTTVAALERLGYGCKDNGLLFSINAHMWTAIIPLIFNGNEAQKKKFLPGLVDGSLIGGNAMSEPNSGSDAFALATTAVKKGAKYILNGSKIFVTNGPIADVLLVFAATDKSKGAQGISAFLVEKEFPGLDLSHKIEKMGIRTSPMGEVFFEDCEVPEENLLGKEGAGSWMFTRSMTWERGSILAAHVGTMQRLLETCIRYANERKQGGQSIGKFQQVATKIVEMKMRVERSRHALYHYGWAMNHRKAVYMEAALAKLEISDSWVKCCEDAIQIHGGYGYMVEYEIERELRDSLGSKLYSGTSEIQRNIVASLLGL
ncbi:MAG: acyl-CoA dehydrogenase family protein [Chthoniobacterales bacterium]|nr:acyl-CoA dehydrogenase family protein [Chthoniobacterales bacterium]